MKQDTEGSSCKDTVSKQRCFVQTLPLSLMDLVTEGHSVFFDFLSLKNFLLFFGKFNGGGASKSTSKPSVLAGWS